MRLVVAAICSTIVLIGCSEVAQTAPSESERSSRSDTVVTRASKAIEIVRQSADALGGAVRLREVQSIAFGYCTPGCRIRNVWR